MSLTGKDMPIIYLPKKSSNTTTLMEKLAKSYINTYLVVQL